MIAVAHLSRSFGATKALTDVSLVVTPGCVFGLVGENGAGKSTLIKHLLGLWRAQTGTVRLFGLDPVADPVAVLGRVGYLSEEPDLPGWMRVGELLRYTQAFHPRWDTGYADQLRDQFGLDTEARVKTLSKGQRARLGLIAAEAHRPDLLILDEPSSGLDPIVRRDILEAIIRTVTDEGRTVLFSSHLLDEVERVSDHLAMLHRGVLRFCAPLDDVKARHRRISSSSSGHSPSHRACPERFAWTEPAGNGRSSATPGRFTRPRWLSIWAPPSSTTRRRRSTRYSSPTPRTDMGSPTAALLWEIWRRHRWTVAVIAGLTVCGTSRRCSRHADRRCSTRTRRRCRRLLAMIAFLLLLGVFNYTESTRGTGDRTIPTAAVHAAGDVAPSRDGPAPRGNRVDRAPVSAVDGPAVQGGSASAPFVAVLLAALSCSTCAALWALECVGSLRLLMLGVIVVALFLLECCRLFRRRLLHHGVRRSSWQGLLRALPSL